MAAIYINGKLCSGGTELVEEVQEGLTEAVTSDAVARYIKPVVQNVTSGVTNPVSSGAVYGALTEQLTNRFQQMKVIASSDNAGTNINWGNNLLLDGTHIYLLVCNRFTSTDNLTTLIYTYGQKPNLTVTRYDINNTNFTIGYNAVGTIHVEYANSNFKGFYSYSFIQLI